MSVNEEEAQEDLAARGSPNPVLSYNMTSRHRRHLGLNGQQAWADTCSAETVHSGLKLAVYGQNECLHACSLMNVVGAQRRGLPE